MAEIRVALIGVGNCASALIQGVQYYKNANEKNSIPGLMHVKFGKYHIRDLKFVAAFEVNKEKIDKDLSEAILPRLSSIDGVLDCRITAQQDGVSSLEFKMSSRATVLPQVFQLIVQSGGEVCDCHLKELPLEEIFVHALRKGGIKEEN